jgi:hypothetical protein
MTRPSTDTYLSDITDAAHREYILRLLDETRAICHTDSLAW